MKNKRVFIIAAVIVLLVSAFVLKTYVFAGKFSYVGTIEATKIDIPARVSSVVAARKVNEGDKVKSGQTLMELSCEDYKLAQSIAGDNYSRAARLYKQGSEAKEAYDQILNRKQDADLRVAWCNVTAPSDGTILNKYHEAGEMVNPGTRLFTMANLQDIYAYIYVPQTSVAKLKLGEKLTGILPEMNNKEFQGTIIHINEEAEFTPKNVQTREERTRLVFGVKIAFDNKEEILKPGMTVEVTLPGE